MSTRPESRIPSLDGLRAVSIAFVLFGHLCGTRHFLPFRAAFFLGDLANLGVRTFFVISGYLITSLMLEERRRFGSISLKHFYLRRTFRIFPPFYVFLAFVVGLAAAQLIQVSGRSLLMAASYTVNFRTNPEWWIGHLWSLSVEEQFYLSWPAVVVLLGPSRAVFSAIGVMGVAPILRVVIAVFFPEHAEGISRTFFTVADAIATGCVLACYAERLQASGKYMNALRSRAFWLIPIGALALNAFPAYLLNLGVGQTLINVGIAITVHRLILMPEGPVGRILNARIPVYVGYLSYSLYLWQQMFLNRYSSGWWAVFPQNLVFAFLAAMASYYVVEQPFLRMRRRIEAGMKKRALVRAAA